MEQGVLLVSAYDSTAHSSNEQDKPMPKGAELAIDGVALQQSPGSTAERRDTPAWSVWFAIRTSRAFLTVWILTMITILGNDQLV